jgi:CheY-like chemotaxis protein
MPQLPGSSGKQAAGTRAASANKNQAKQSGAKIKILLADDSITMHRAVTLGLKNEPFEVITCDNGQDALRLALEHIPRVVLADLDMPGLTGVELCQAIRAEPTLRDTRVVLLCGSFDQIDEARLNSVQADGRLWKPFESHALVALIQTLLKAPAHARGKSAEPTLVGPSDFDETSPDLARDMTRETFREATRPGSRMDPSLDQREHNPEPELPEPKNQPEPEARVQAEPQARQKLPKLEETSFPEESSDSSMASVSEDVAASNLWSLDYEPQLVDPLAGSGMDPSVLDDPMTPPSDEVEFQIVTNSLELSEPELPPSSGENEVEELPPLPESFEDERFDEAQIERIGLKANANENEIHSPATPTSALPILNKQQINEWSEDADFSSFRGDSDKTSTRGGPSPVGSKLPPPPRGAGLSEAEIRVIIRQEIAEAFQGWLQKKLQDKLAQVMAEIERE